MIGRYDLFKRIQEAVNGFEDGTYTITDLDNPNGAKVQPILCLEGYQVSIINEANKDNREQFNKDFNLLSTIVGKDADEVLNALYVGVYNGEVEISWKVYTADLAFVIARVFNQYSIWDWRRKREIKTSDSHRVPLDRII